MGEDFFKTVSENKKPDGYHEELQRRASIDMLSGLLNRDTTERFIKYQLEKMAPEDSCALFIVDLDDFKQVNDLLGHPVGDEVIRQSAAILSDMFRANDIVGRLGGDEFVVFLHGQLTEQIVAEKAAAICERLQLIPGESETVNVTASVGVYMAPKGQKFEGLYQSADLALYKAKKSGKHQFCMKNHDALQGEENHPTGVITLSDQLENMESGVALVEMRETPQIVYVSPSFCRIIGANEKKFILPKPLHELVHPDELSHVISVLLDGIHREHVVEITHRVHAGAEQGWHWWQIRAVRIEYSSDYPVMLVTATDVSKLKETQDDQAEQIRSLQTAFDLTSRRIWEVDIDSRTFRGDVHETKNDAFDKGELKFPEELIDNGMIHPDSVTRFRIFANELLGGSAHGFGNFAVLDSESGCYGWFALSYRMLFDDVGRAMRAVGVLETLPNSITGEDNWSPDMYRLPENMAADLVMRLRANLDLDRVESLWIEGSDFSRRVQDIRCSEMLQQEKQRIFCKDDQSDFISSFDRDALLRLYHSGRRWLCAEYRRADRSGNIRWVRHILYLTEEPVSRNVYLFAYMLWLDPDRYFERIIRGKQGRDAHSRLYDRDSMQRITETLFSNRETGNRAVAVLQINGMDKQTVGSAHERMIYGISVGLSLVMGGSCLLGQYDLNHIVAVLPSVTDKDLLRRRLEESISTLRRLLKPEPEYKSIRFVVGVDLMPSATANYRAMLMRVIQECSFHWNSSTDTVYFVQEREESGCAHLHEKRDGEISSHTEEMMRPLSEKEKDLALDGISTMLAARTLDASVSGVLRAIGEYYRADRVYSLMLVKNSKAVIMTFEWTNGSKRSIQQVVSGTPIDRFPMLVKCMREKAPVCLSKQTPDNTDGEEGDGGMPWHFMAFPMIQGSQDTIIGFLCIENARKHPVDAAVFGTLLPFMMQQRERFSNEGNRSALTEQFMNVPDLLAYPETLQTLNSEYYSSMGVVCLDIPEHIAANSKHDFEYYSRMLWYVANTMAEIFGKALMFRTRDSEFVAFYPNTTREVFLGCCGRLLSIIHRRYPKQVRIGQAWSNGAFAGKHLLEKAYAVMRNATTETFERNSDILFNIADADAVDLVKRGQFTVYFQPKVDVRTGAMVGAEALVRMIGDGGKIIPPSQFIPLLEETSAIREIDMFVLERSLTKMEEWRDAGLGIVPVAVNLSRTTLAHPSTIASVLAVQSRYPNIPNSAIELEITEYSDRMDATELRDIVESFRSCGLHMSLDDFGSRYANLALFTNVKFETIKLDKSLIDNMNNNLISRMLIRDLVEICNTCGMKCVAEGVETHEQVSALMDIGCIYVQGFYYDRPLPADEFEKKYLRSNAPVVGR